MFWFCFVWIAWCFMHSLLIAPPVSDYVKNQMGTKARYYRLVYNVLSIITLLPLLVFTWIDSGEIVFSWSGWAVVVRIILFVGAMSCFIGGAKGYNLQHFLGLQQIREGKDSLLLGDEHSFSEVGIFGLVRHPWYVGSFLFVWSVFAVYYEKNFAVAVILSIYLVVGTFLEERKIIAEHGELYRRYRARVSMFIPVKWLIRRYF
ncbi:MAG: protein-S-isoprenylcysteine O-methyltransferase Ste14 [Desulforhopalus sp.]